jgi:transcriptional regulator with XRE-family HTH domain
MNAMERVQRRLRLLLDERTSSGKLRQKRLAAYVGLLTHGKPYSEAWISNILAGRKGIRLTELDAVADFFQVPPGELVRHEGDALVEVSPTEMAILRKFRRFDEDDFRSYLQILGLGHHAPPPKPKPPKFRKTHPEEK